MEFTFDALGYDEQGAGSFIIIAATHDDVPFAPVLFQANEDGTRTDVSDRIAEFTYFDGSGYSTVQGGEWGMLSFHGNEVSITVKLVEGTVLSSSFSHVIEVVVN